MNGAPGNGPGGGYLRLRPASSKPKGVLALLAASRVGAWTPPLPPSPLPGAGDTGQSAQVRTSTDAAALAAGRRF